MLVAPLPPVLGAEVKHDKAFALLIGLKNKLTSQSLSPNNKQALPSFNSKEDVMLFFKFYDHKTSTLRYVFRMHLPVSANLSEFIYIFLLFIVVF